MRGGVIKVSYELLADLLHLPSGVRVAAVGSRDDGILGSFEVLLRSDDDFLPEVPEGERFPEGNLLITSHYETVTFQARD